MLADEVCRPKNGDLCKESPAVEIIVVTEAGRSSTAKILIKRSFPDRQTTAFVANAVSAMNTLEKAYDALLNMEPEITLPEPLRKRAEVPILRMLELSR